MSRCFDFFVDFAEKGKKVQKWDAKNGINNVF